jgi:DNA polymerase
MTDRLHLDFETRSELDLSERGMHNYAVHPSTQVLMLAWAINDRTVNLWEPHRNPKPPVELAEALADPFVDKPAWNAPFERNIMLHRMGLDVPLEEWVDPSVWARYLSLPAGLEDAGEVLGLSEDEAKLKEGKELIQLFCVPKALGGGEGLFGSLPTVWNDWTTHPEAWERFCEYCRQDVRTERTIAKKITKLQPPPSERKLWALDQRINERGMPVDMELVAGAAKVAEIERGLLDQRLRALTGLENPGSVPQMLGWARQHGYPFNALGKAFVQRALRGEGEITPECREALMLRQQASKSSVHKLEALRLLVSADGRLRNQFVFYGASTLRWGSRGVQIQNLPRPTKEVEKNTERAVELLRAGNHALIAAEFTSPLDVVTSCLRPMFRAPKGKKLVVADLNAIENRKLAWLSRSPAMLSVYAEGRCPYIDFATELYGQSYEELWHEWKVLGDGSKRTMAKPAVLGCFGADTPVLTDRGWLRIVDVRLMDKLWDGVEWVMHDGAVYQGIKNTILLHGTRVTPDHKILTPNGWRKACDLEESQLSNSAMLLACELLSDIPWTCGEKPTTTFGAIADICPLSFSQIWRWGSLSHADPVLRTRDADNSFLPPVENPDSCSGLGSSYNSVETKKMCLFTSANAPNAGTNTPFKSVILREGTQSVAKPVSMRIDSYHSQSGQRVIVSDHGLLSESVVTQQEAAVTCANAQYVGHRELSNRMSLREAPLPVDASNRQADLSSSLERIAVFDILNCGPRNRFIVLTGSGPLVVHNCGYQLGGGEVQIDENGDEVKTGLLGYASAMNVEMTPEQAARAVALFRAKYPEVKQYWYDLEEAALSAVRNPGQRFPVGQVTFHCTGKKMLQIHLPSGRAIHYLQPEVKATEITYQDRTFTKDALTYMGKDQQTKQWVRKYSRGGHLTENLCQALARDVLVHGMIQAEERGFEVVGHVHDELITLADVDSPLGARDLEDCMRAVPVWAGAGDVRERDGTVLYSWPALPLNAEGYEDDHYRKG